MKPLRGKLMGCQCALMPRLVCGAKSRSCFSVGDWYFQLVDAAMCRPVGVHH